MNIALCDDEPKELENTRILIGEYTAGKNLSLTVNTYVRSTDLLNALEMGDRFDLIFLDVYMGQSHGLEVARQIRELDQTCGIIFLTNSRDHAIEGYEVRAILYLIKPLTLPNLSKAMDQALASASGPRERQLQIKTRQGTFAFLLKDLIYAESNARILTAYLKGGEKIIFYDRLDNFEKRCGDPRFHRCHKSFLINLDHVYGVVNKAVQMKSGEVIPISLSPQETKEAFARHLAQKL